MQSRIAIVGSLTILIAGCTNPTGFSRPHGLTNADLNPVGSATAAEMIDIESELANNKTLSGKILTAIALERVTGRKPHPSRLAPSK